MREVASGEDVGLRPAHQGGRNNLSSLPSPRFEFGPFSLRNRGEALYRDGKPVRLGSRARAILTALVARAGQVVSKADLMAEVWPNTIVVENNLTVHITALRQALGEGRDGAQYIVNVPGRGYRFVASVREGLDNEGSVFLPASVPAPTNLPVRLRPAVALSSAIGDVAAKLRRGNLVTVTGSAGVGKTTLALHVALAERPHHPDGAWMVDLAALREAEHIPAAIAATMRIELGSADATTSLVIALRRCKTLLLLDNCEHLIDAVADLAAHINLQCPDVVLLATSREPLRVAGEAIYGLAPLDVPPHSLTMSASEAMSYPAVQLFAQQVAATMNGFSLLDEDADAAASICRRLDGLPLAIEFASPLVTTFGISGLAARLDERLKLIQIDIRGASNRHRTLTAALDWSYGLLENAEQVALKRLAIFAGGFALEGAAAIIGTEDLGELGGLLARLHAKSLITRDISSKDLRFRLLETTRAYAIEKLENTGEATEIRRRHATYYTDLLRRHRVNLSEWNVGQDIIELDNIRTALRFAMDPGGDTDLALYLASATMPVWLELSLMAECRARLREVLALLTPEQAMSPMGWDLEITHRMNEMATVGIGSEDYGRWMEPASPAPGDLDMMLRQVQDTSIRFVWNCRRGDAAETRRFAKKHARLMGQDDSLQSQISIAWHDGLCAFYLGEFREAKVQLRRFIELQTAEERRNFSGRTGLDRTQPARGMLGATLCVLGEVEAGLCEVRLVEETERKTDRAWAVMERKLWAFVAYEAASVEPVDFEADLETFLEMAHAQGFEGNIGLGLGLQGVLAARQSCFVQAESLLRQSVTFLRGNGFEWCAPWFQAQLALSLSCQGRFAEGLEIAEGWMRRDRNPTGWYAAELHRSIGRLRALAGDKDQAEHSLLGALAIADAQGAMAWAERARDDLRILHGFV